jgi:saccharopine dehydrogenase-like NADP-dependent oxidoreductase
MQARAKRVLLFGSGLVSKPVLIYFAQFDGYKVTVVSNDKSSGEDLVKDFKGKAECIVAKIEDRDVCLKLVKEHDIALSLLPAPLHPIVAEYCLEAGKHMVTTSYLNPTIEKRNPEVVKKNLIFLNEVGLDPGIDHIVTLKMIDDIRQKGGKVRALYSYCGGLITPDCIDNPLGYKFSWSPLGVFRALGNDAKYLMNGKIIDVPGKNLLYDSQDFNVNNALNIVKYPNRDSLKYREMYGIPEVESLYRGTFRYKGFCEIIAAFKDLGFLSETKVAPNCSTWLQMVDENIKGVSKAGTVFSESEAKDLLADLTRTYPGSVDEFSLLAKITEHPFWKTLDKSKAADRVKLIVEGLIFFNLLDNKTPLNASKTYLENFLDRVTPLMQLKKTDSDCVVMTIIIEALYSKTQINEDLRFQMIINGDKGGLSAMSKTVGFPIAIASKLILDGKITRSGVIGPFTPDVYGPIYEELVRMNLIQKYTTKQFKPKL